MPGTSVLKADYTTVNKSGKIFATKRKLDLLLGCERKAFGVIELITRPLTDVEGSTVCLASQVAV